MEIKRKFEMAVVVNRRYVIRQATAHRQMTCAECGEPMLTTEQVAKIFSLAQRRVFRFIEAGAVHYAETEAGTAMICPTSLAMVLDGKARNNPHKTAIEGENEYEKD